MLGRYGGSNLSREEKAVGFSLCMASLLVILLLYYFYNKKRKESFVNYAKKHGFTYREKDSHFPYRSTQIVFASDEHFDRSFENILIGEKDGVSFWTSDYNYKTFNSGTYRTRQHYRTICVIPRKKTNIPNFFVESESSCYSMFGKKQEAKGIVFEEDKEFSKNFTLRGANENRIRGIFDESVRKAFIKIRYKDYKFEWCNDGLILLYNGNLFPDGRMRMVKDASNIVEKILNPAS